MNLLLRRLGVAAVAALTAAAPWHWTPAAAHAGCGAPPPCIIIVTEGKRGYEATANFFSIRVSPMMATPVTVRFQTVDGTARRGLDYVPLTGEIVTVPAGTTKVRVPVQLLADGIAEPDEFFDGVISDPSTGTIVDDRARMTITDGPAP